MTHIKGSAIEIFGEVPSDKITGTTIYLQSLIDPDGNDLASSQILEFSTETGKENIASVVWQSTSSNIIGRYMYLLKSVNGTKENFAKGYFNLIEDDQ